MKATAAVAVVLAALTACQQGPAMKPRVDYLEIDRDFDARAPADVAVLRVEAPGGMDASLRKSLRRQVYQILIERGYAPVALEFVDDRLRDEGLLETRLAYRESWNTTPFKGFFFCDAVMMVSIESFREEGSPDNAGIELWGKAALFEGESMDRLYEHYVRRNLRLSDPGSRQQYLDQAVRDFARDLLAYLPRKPERVLNRADPTETP